MPLTTEDLNLKFKKPSLLRICQFLFASSILLIIFGSIGPQAIQDSLNDDLEEYVCTLLMKGNMRPWMTFKRRQETIELDTSKIYDLSGGYPSRKPVRLKKDYFELKYFSNKEKTITLNLIEETPSRLVFGGYVLPSNRFFILDKSSMNIFRVTNIFRATSPFDAVGSMRDSKRWAVLGKCERRKPLIPRTTQSLQDSLIKLSKTRIKIINISDTES